MNKLLSDHGRIAAFGFIGAFIIFMLTPMLYNLAIGTTEPPKLTYPTGLETCIESTEYMNPYHMDMLNTWRDQVVREEVRIYTSGLDKKEYNMSLTNTCLNCHGDRAEFCDKCHEYAGVEPVCWDCHVTPEESR